ncbi:MAG: TrmH family RNA methyltransferase [Patescibacteria group bacterium]
MHYNEPMVVILHNIRSTHNVGSMFRTADAAGVDKLYLSGITPIPLDRFGKVRPDVAKVALGAELSIPWEYVSSTVRIIKKLKKNGYVIVSLEQSKNSVVYNKIKFSKNKKIALVVGNEVKGLSQNILELSDVVMEIPMKGNKESLNVSVAFGIAVYALTKD